MDDHDDGDDDNGDDDDDDLIGGLVDSNECNFSRGAG